MSAICHACNSQYFAINDQSYPCDDCGLRASICKNCHPADISQVVICDDCQPCDEQTKYAKTSCSGCDKWFNKLRYINYCDDCEKNEVPVCGICHYDNLYTRCENCILLENFIVS